ncbi:MAG TPA: hypothetical protein VNJ01_07755 [Bacteriovoracaceae bacterium]|nr:hypothetical protein [Bacteriovoracaceae bacterium]
MSTREFHPYGEFIPSKPRCMIIGSFPIGKFTDPGRRHEIKAHEFDFFFGGEKNLLWKLVGDCFGQSLKTRQALEEFLEENGMAIGDVICSCERKKGSASDADLFRIEWNQDLFSVIQKNNIKKIFFTSRQVEKWFLRLFPHSESLEKTLLISPSAQIFRSLSRREDFIIWKKNHPKEKSYNFILLDYQNKIAQD